MKKLPLFHRWREMVRCKAGEALRSGKSVSYVSMSSDEGQSRTPRTGEMAVYRQPREE